MQARGRTVFMRIGVLFTSLLNPVLLINFYESLREKIRLRAKMSKNDPTMISDLKLARELKIMLVAFLKMELGMEILYQTAGQILLLLLNRSDTITTGGLQTLFKQDSRIPGVSTENIIVFSIIMSLRSGISKHMKSVIADKIVFPSTSKFVVFLWSVFAIARRMLTLVFFFVPSLGLLNLLHHWRAEQTPFWIRRDAAAQGYMSPADTLQLFNMTETVLWTDIDRWEGTLVLEKVPSEGS